MAKRKVVVVGGGAAGFFGAISIAEHAQSPIDITILEATAEPLKKVLMSGGGRCNVTHHCFDVELLTKNYPRGERELRSPFYQFSAADTVQWFQKRGVALKTEADGRMFPTTDSSATIANCLKYSAEKNNVEILLHHRVEHILQNENNTFSIQTNKGKIQADAVLWASGSHQNSWKILTELGVQCIEPVPSLFTFNIKHALLSGLEGISMPNATVKIKDSKIQTNGPILITHWGLSGPAILRSSAWGARFLHQKKYVFDVVINWIQLEKKDCVEILQQQKKNNPKKSVSANALFEIPKRLWQRIVLVVGIDEQKNWADISNALIEKMAETLCTCVLPVTGKSTFKDEFVTAGGVNLKEVHFKTFEHKSIKNLYFAGEVLDIDAITGGFNFQNAWTGGFIAGKSIAESL